MKLEEHGEMQAYGRQDDGLRSDERTKKVHPLVLGDTIRPRLRLLGNLLGDFGVANDEEGPVERPNIEEHDIRVANGLDHGREHPVLRNEVTPLFPRSASLLSVVFIPSCCSLSIVNKSEA